MAAKYGVSIMCASKKRAEKMAKEIKKSGYGALVEKNVGASAVEYPYLVRRTNNPIKAARTPERPMQRREQRLDLGGGKAPRITPRTPRLRR